MGVYHSGIELFGTEIAFGGSDSDSTGIFMCLPMHTVSSHHFGEQFELLSSTCVGYTKMSFSHLTKLVDLMCPDWPANSYNLIARNCNHFVEAFLAQIACRQQLPSFVNRCSRLAVLVKCCLPKIITDMDFSLHSDMYVPYKPLLLTNVAALSPYHSQQWAGLVAKALPAEAGLIALLSKCKGAVTHYMQTEKPNLSALLPLQVTLHCYGSCVFSAIAISTFPIRLKAAS